jgi:GMP synthase-like glutamine amidotransferase
MAARPIAIIEHEGGVSPGHFASWLAARALPSELIQIHASGELPSTAKGFAGICSLGGSMSVNDPLPWIADELALLRDAVQRGVPVIGHCLGGQLLARALGARVTRSAAKEIGWLPLDVVGARGAEWFGSSELPEIFQWHEDVFELPANAARLASTRLATNQAFVARHDDVEHLGMQFHVEITPEIVADWTSSPAAAQEIAAERAANGAAGVQWIDEIRRDLPNRAARARAIAWNLYDRWARGIGRAKAT